MLNDISVNLLLESEDSRDGSIYFKGSKISLALSDEQLIIFDGIESRKIIEKISFDVILGTKFIASKKSKCSLEVYLYEIPSFYCSSAKTRVFRCLKFSNMEETRCRYWADAISCAAKGELKRSITPDESGTNRVDITVSRKKNFLVFINPVSGKGTAIKAWNSVVHNMLMQAGVNIEAITTTHANHARQFVETQDITKYDAILTVGGDGLLYEVVNGICDRKDAVDVLARVALLPIPGGSGNGLAKCILMDCGEAFSLVNATFVAIKGTPHPMDLSYVETKTSRQYSFLMLGWGLISDIDILTEFMRCLGELRFHLGAVYYIGRKKMYPGRLSLLNYSETNLPPKDIELSSLQEPVGHSSSSDDSGTWTVIDGSFVLVWILQVPYVSSTVYACPGKRLDDGKFTILAIQDISRCALIDILLGMDSGKHIDNPAVKTYRASAYRLEPLVNEGLFSLDGEVVEYGPIQGAIRPSMARVLKIPQK